MCNNTVIQYVPRGFDYRAVEMECGNTGIHGETLYCEECEAEFEKKGHPDYCEHGTYLYPEHGGDVICFACEMGYE